MTTERGGVAARSALVSAEVTATLVVAHAAAGGALPSAGWVAAMAAAVFGAGLLVLRGSVRAAVVLPALFAAQVGLHLWLVALTPAAHAGHAAHGAGPELHLSWPMLAAHVVGAVVTALAWHVRARAAHAVLTLVLASPVLVSRPPRLRAATRTVRPAARLLLALAPRRGPPVALPATA